MALKWAAGAEVQSVTGGVETETIVGSPTIDTTTKRSGAASWNFNPSATIHSIRHGINSGSVLSATIYAKFALYITSAPAGLTPIFRISQGTTDRISIRMNSNRTLELWGTAQVGSDSTALNTGTWYDIEIRAVVGAGGTTTELEARINQSSFASATGLSIGAIDSVVFGVITSATMNINIDDVIVCDGSGSDFNTWPGAMRLALATLSGTTAGVWRPLSGSNHANVDDLPPNDSTDYVDTQARANNDTDIYTIATHSDIGSSDTINAVFVGVRYARSASNTSDTFVARLTLDGNTAESTTFQANGSTFRTNANATPRFYQLVAYKVPTSGVSITKSKIDAGSTGLRIVSAANSNDALVTALWVYVAFTAGGGGNVTTSQTITGVARIQKSVTQTQSGVARIRKSVLQTIAGLARITATTLRTIAGLARIAITKNTSTTYKGKALYFDGNDYVERSVVLTAQDNWTIEARWRSGTDVGDGNTIFYNGQDNGVGGFNGYGICINSGRIAILYGGVNFVTSQTTYDQNTEYHVVATRRSGTLHTWINGVKDIGTYSGTPNTPSNITTMGVQKGSDGSYGRWAVGATIDEVRLYSRAMENTEAASLYTGGYTDNSNLELLWSHDWLIPGDTTVTDDSGNGRSGTITGATVVDGLSAYWLPFKGVARIRKTVQQTISGVANITGTNSTTTRTITGVARILKTVAQTVTGVARIRKTVSATQTGIARIRKTVTQTITGIARIRKSVSQTIAGVARIQNTATRTITGVSRITIRTLQTITGVARIRKSVSQTITGIARITIRTTRTQAGLARIRKTVQATIAGVSSIAIRTTRTITGVSAIRKTVTRTITAVSRIQKTVQATQSGVARIRNTVTRTIAGVARVRVSVLRTIAGQSRIRKSVLQTITGLSRITATTLRTISGVAAIRKTTTRTITGVANINGSVQRLVTGVANIRNSTLRTIQGLARVQVRVLRTITGISRISARTTRTIAGVSRITTSTVRTVLGTARIQKTVARTISGVSKITGGTQRLISGIARLQKSSLQTISGVSRIGLNQNRTILGRSRITAKVLRTIAGIARITRTGVGTIVGLARIRKTGTQAITGVARVQATVQKQQSGIARLVGRVLQTITGRATITQTSTQSITGVARIIDFIGTRIPVDVDMSGPISLIALLADNTDILVEVEGAVTSNARQNVYATVELQSGSISLEVE